MKNYIETVLAPRLQGDGGWVEIAEEREDALTLVFRGECSKCLILDRCVNWMTEQLEREFGRPVKLTAVRMKPYFWDQN